MKVILTNHFPLEGSGSGIYTQNVALELTRMGHEVLVIAPDHRRVEGYPFQVRTIVFSNGKNTGYDLPFNFPCFTTHPVSNNTFSALSDAQMNAYVETYRRVIQEAVEDFRPEIIHAQHLWVGTYCAARTGVPYVATVHGTDLMGYEQDERYRPLAHEAVEKAGKIISISREITEKTKEIYGVADEKIVTILNGFSTDIFHVMEGVSKDDVFAEFRIPPAEYLVSFVGKLTEFKGVDVLIKAAAVYERELGSVSTLIVGMGALLEDLKKLAAECGVENVHFLGHQDQRTVARINNAADLAVFPSRVEPFGLVAIEALACGTPVVTTNQGGFPDFINDKVGRMVDVDAPDQLARAVVEEIRGEAKKKKGSFAASYAAESFSWKRKVREFYAIYREVTGG